MKDKQYFINEAIKLSKYAVDHNKGGPFGVVIVKDGEIIGRGYNKVTSENNPILHAEIVAIQEACKKLGTFDLSGCEIYSSCEPCPMCLSACYWAKLDKLYFANSRKDAKKIGFDDDFIYNEIPLPIEERSLKTEKLDNAEAFKVFEQWSKKKDRVEY
jgi:guanine deaminase